MGEVGEGPFAGAAAFAPALAQEHGGARVAVGHGVDIHGNTLSYSKPYINIFNHIYMGTLWNQQKSNSLAKLPTYVRFQTLRTRNFGLDVQKVYSATGAAGRFTVFNIRGNHYRLIT